MDLHDNGDDILQIPDIELAALVSLLREDKMTHEHWNMLDNYYRFYSERCDLGSSEIIMSSDMITKQVKCRKQIERMHEDMTQSLNNDDTIIDSTFLLLRGLNLAFHVDWNDDLAGDNDLVWFDQAKRMFRISLEKGMTKAAYYYGLLYLGPDITDIPSRATFRNDDLDIARGLWIQGIHMNGNDVHCLMALGQSYLCNSSEPPDYTQAVQFLQLALEKGEKRVITDLSIIRVHEPELVTPYGKWQAKYDVHSWVSPQVKREMYITMLIFRHRFRFIRELVTFLLEWVCTGPKRTRRPRELFIADL